MLQDISGALVFFWVNDTQVHMGHEALMLLDQCGSLMCMDQRGAPMYFWVVGTLVHNNLEELVHLDQCGE